MPPFINLSIIRCESRVKLCNPGNGVALSPIPRCSSDWKGSLRVIPDQGHQQLIVKKSQTDINHHHHHVALSARISLTLSRHPSLSSIASCSSSGLLPVSAQSCCMYARAGRPAFARPCEGVHRSISLMNSSLLLQQCTACLVRLILIVFVMGGRWPYSCCFVRCYLQDLINISRSILVWLPSRFFLIHLVSVDVVHPYSSIDTTTASNRWHLHTKRLVTETCWQVNLPRQLDLINRDRHRHSTTKGIDS